MLKGKVGDICAARVRKHFAEGGVIKDLIMVFDTDVNAKGKSIAKMAPMFDEGDGIGAEEANRDLAGFIFLKYSTFKADAMAGLMQMIICENPNLALLKFPEDYFTY